jgi:hypothetical protein
MLSTLFIMLSGAVLCFILLLVLLSLCAGPAHPA